MAKTLSELVRSVDRFADACRRFFVVAERWGSPITEIPIEGVDWSATRLFERSEIHALLVSTEQSVDRLRTDCNDMDVTLPAQWQTIFRSASNLARHACDEAHKEGWFEGRFTIIKGSYITHELRKAVGLLAFLSEVMTVQGLSHAVREVLEAILQHGPTKGDYLAHLAKGADVQDSTFREMLAEMVDDGLLNSGRGRYSTGYRLTDRGTQLAQLSGQLTDF